MQKMETTEITSRKDHLAWCKKRAIEYCDQGDIVQAWASMVSDMRKHSETANHAAIMIGTQMMMVSILNTPSAMRDFIEGFN